MAQSSGSFWGGVNNNYQKLRVEWRSTQDIERNSSTIIADMYLDFVGDLYINTRNDNSTTIDGTYYQWSSPRISSSSSSSIYLATVSKEVYHDEYGNKTFNISSIFNIRATLSGRYYESITANSGNIELPNIPRASTITVNDANIGSSTTININKKASSFTTNLYWRVQGDSNWNYIDNTNQYSYGWVVPTSLYSTIPNNKTIVCEFLARTLSGSTIVGDKTTSATFTATGTPIINNVTIYDINQDTIDLTGNIRNLVMYHSTAKVSVDVSPQNSASISSVNVNGANATYNSTSEKWELNILNVTTNKFQIYVTDSRGYYNTNNQIVTKVDYIPLTINSTIDRNEPTDGKVNISINGNYFNDTFGQSSNSLTVQYRYIEYGGTYQDNWTSLTPTITNNTYTLTAQLSNFDYTKQYEFQVRAYDLLEEQQIIGISVSKGIPTYNWGEDFFNVNGTLKVNNIPIQTATNMFPVGSIYMSVNNVNPSTYFGGTWVAWGSGRVVVGVDTSQTEFNTVEKTGGSKELQQHNHTGTVDYNGDHAHQIGADDDGSGGGYYSTVHKGGVSGSGRQEWTSTNGGHTHTFTTGNAGSGNSGNLQPYITCYMFKRTA